MSSNETLQTLELSAENNTALVTEQDAPQMTNDQVCAMMLKTYTPHYNKLVDKLTVFQAREMLKALPVYPLENDSYNPKKPHVRECFAIAERLLQAKYGLIMDTMMKNILQEQGVVENTAPINKGEENTNE